jgi:hypothetical protein
MTARDATFAAYALIGVALVTLQAVAWRRGSVTLGQLSDASCAGDPTSRSSEIPSMPGRTLWAGV